MRKYIFIDQSIETLREEKSTKKVRQYQLLVDQCERYFSYNLPKEHPKQSTTYMGMAIANLSLLYLLSDDIKYYNEALRFIDTVCGWEKWGNAHLVNVDLSASWIMFGLSLGYNWLSDKLEDSFKKMVEDKLILQASIMYQFHQDTYGEGWSTNFFQNHNWINMTGLAAAGYAIGDKDLQSSAWIEACTTNFEQVYPYLPEDGSSYEGVVYWRYGALWLYIYAALAKNQTGRNYFKECQFLENSFFYRLYQATPDLEQTANFGDTHDTRSGHSTALYYKVASEYNNGYAQNLADIVEREFLEKEAALSKIKPGILPEAWLNFLWYDSEVKIESFNTLPLVKYFDDLGLVSYRSSWDRDALFFSFKCGAPGGKKQWTHLWELKEKGIDAFALSHQHPDNLSFIIFANDDYLVIDDGYNRNMKAAYHSVPLVDNIGYPVEDTGDTLTDSAIYLKDNDPNFKPSDYIASINEFMTVNNSMIINADAHKMYHPDLKLDKLERVIITNGHNYFIIIDSFASSIAHTYQFLLQGASAYQTSNLGYTIRNAKASLNVIPLNKDLVDSLVPATIKAVMTTQEPDNYTIQELNTLVLATKEKHQKYQMINLLTIDSKITNHTVTKHYHDDFDSIVIKNDEFTDIFITSKTGIHDNNIISDASYLLLSYYDNNLVDYIVYNGSYLAVDGVVILDKDKKANYIKGSE